MNEASNLGMVRGFFVVFLNFQWTKWKTTFDNKSSFLRVSLIPFLWVQECNAILLAKKQQQKKKHRRPTRNKKWNKQMHMVFSKKFFFFPPAHQLSHYLSPFTRGSERPAFSKPPKTEQGGMWQGTAGGHNWHPRAWDLHRSYGRQGSPENSWEPKPEGGQCLHPAQREQEAPHAAFTHLKGPA